MSIYFTLKVTELQGGKKVSHCRIIKNRI